MALLEDADTNSLADDVLYGARAIAAYTGRAERQIYYLASKGALPIWHMPGGKELISRKSLLRKAFAPPRSEG